VSDLLELSPEELRELERLVAEQFGQTRDRRSHPRSPYPAPAKVTPLCQDGRVRYTQTVACRDLSPGGVCFVWPGRVDFQQAVIELGQERERLLMRARVAWSKPSPLDPASSLVGCQFLERLRQGS
jgi:hypothetical protein